MPAVEKGMEFARFGTGFVRRKIGSKDWQPIALDDLPDAALQKLDVVQTRKQIIRERGVDPLDPPRAGFKFLRRNGQPE